MNTRHPAGFRPILPLCALLCGASPVRATVTLQNWTSAPWNATGGATAFAGTVTDPDFEGGTSATFSFVAPLAGVGTANPSNPDFAAAMPSVFGFESTGFGVTETTVGRFNTGEAFTLQADHAFALESIRWAEYTGDELLHLSWTHEGQPASLLFDCPPGPFYTNTVFGNVVADANTPLRIANVSPSGASLAGRLRVNRVSVALAPGDPPPDPLPDIPGSMILLRGWSLWPWNAVSGVTSFSGALTAPENGGTPATTTFANARTGVDVSNPDAPNFGPSAASYFGFESTGFGVGNATVGRFDRGESFSVSCVQPFRFEELKWREINGDERLHVSWTGGGEPRSAVFNLTADRMFLTNVMADANSPVTFTNVSPTNSPLSGRIRFEYLTIALLFHEEPVYDFSAPDGFAPHSGVNLAGAEFGGYAFWPTEAAQWNYYQAKGFKLMRIPFKWERIQPTLYGAVSFSQLDTIVSLASARGMQVVLDMHNYARYTNQVIGTAAVPNAAFKDVWRKLAAHFSGNPAVYGYGIMNEPHDTAWLWPAAAQAAADGIREVDATTWIIVGGDNWSGASSWPTSNANLDVQDAQGRVMYEAHCYFDSNSDGVYNSYDTEKPVWNVGPLRVAPFVTWLQQRGARGFVGEYGIPKNDARWKPILDTFLSYLFANGLSGTYWAGGMHWSNYLLDCSPTSNYTVDAPQMDVLEDYAF